MAIEDPRYPVSRHEGLQQSSESHHLHRTIERTVRFPSREGSCCGSASDLLQSSWLPAGMRPRQTCPRNSNWIISIVAAFLWALECPGPLSGIREIRPPKLAQLTPPMEYK